MATWGSPILRSIWVCVGLLLVSWNKNTRIFDVQISTTACRRWSLRRCGGTGTRWRHTAKIMGMLGRFHHMENIIDIMEIYGYGSIPIDTFLVGWTSIYQLFWGSLGTRVLTHSHISIKNQTGDSTLEDHWPKNVFGTTRCGSILSHWSLLKVLFFHAISGDVTQDRPGRSLLSADWWRCWPPLQLGEGHPPTSASWGMGSLIGTGSPFFLVPM